MTIKTWAASALATAAILAGTAASLAHHSFSMFDPAQEIVLKGEVVRWNFVSPHTFMMIRDEAGKVWAFEGSAPPTLLTRTPLMKGDTFKSGDMLTVVYCPLRDGRAGGAIGVFVTPDGTAYNPADGGCRANQRINEWPTWIEKGYTSLEEARKGENIQ